MSRRENSLKNMATGLLGQTVTLALQFVYRTIFIQILGLTYLSVNGLFANILTIFSFAELGVGQAIVFSLYKPIAQQDTEKIRGLMELYKKTYRGIGIAIIALGMMFYPFLPVLLRGSADGIEHLSLIYGLFVLESGVSYFFSYRQSYLSACQKQYLLNLFGCAFSLLREVLRIFLLVTTRQYIPVLLFSCGWTIFQNAWYAWKIGRIFPYIKDTRGAELKAEEKRTVFQNIRALIIYKVGTLALNSTDNIIITAVVGLTCVGLYSNYATLVSSVSVFITVLFSSLTASIGDLNAGDDVSKKKQMFHVVNMATFWIYSIASVCFLVALTPTVRLWLGEAYLLDFPTVLVISLNIYIAGMLYAPFNYRQTMGLFVYGKWRPVISAVINIVVSILLGSWLGLKGVLAGTAIARLTTNAWFDPYIVYKKGFGARPWEYFLHYVLYFLLFAASVVIGLGISQITLLGGLADILLHCVLCGMVLSAVYALLLFRTASFAYLLAAARSMLKGVMARVRRRKGGA